ncbi:MAG: hypothetical protein FWG25_05655, partial [Promicromonosporaceae bacterium]|nr:hypothetical protein [Promicromonosporaceae bacterium]
MVWYQVAGATLGQSPLATAPSVAGLAIIALLAIALLVVVPAFTRRRRAIVNAQREAKLSKEARVLRSITPVSQRSRGEQGLTNRVSLRAGEISAPTPQVMENVMTSSETGAAEVRSDRVTERQAYLAKRAGRARRRLVLTSALVLVSAILWVMTIHQVQVMLPFVWPSWPAIATTTMLALVLVSGRRAAQAAAAADQRYSELTGAKAADERTSLGSLSDSATMSGNSPSASLSETDLAADYEHDSIWAEPDEGFSFDTHNIPVSRPEWLAGKSPEFQATNQNTPEPAGRGAHLRVPVSAAQHAVASVGVAYDTELIPQAEQYAAVVEAMRDDPMAEPWGGQVQASEIVVGGARDGRAL